MRALRPFACDGGGEPVGCHASGGRMFVALLLALAAETAPAPDTKAAASSPPAAKSEEMICRTEQVTGSRFPKRICRSRAEIEQKRADDQERVRDNQRSFAPGA